jgi:hypothetical protein
MENIDVSKNINMDNIINDFRSLLKRFDFNTCFDLIITREKYPELFYPDSYQPTPEYFKLKQEI